MTLSIAEPRVAPLFWTPLLTDAWPEREQWNQALFDVIMARRAEQPGVTLSNVHGWQSQTDMLEWGGPAAQRLCDDVLKRCDEYSIDLREEGRRRFVWLPEMWSNVNEQGASNQTHCHPGAQWAAVYYVEDGYGGSDDPALGGELMFLDPRFPMVRMREPDLRYRRQNGSYDHQEVWIRPKTGQIVMFPAWMMHGVRPYHGTGVRISIAINISSRPRWGE
jgi:uncharacterized protein (TIGR02466 family)